MVFGLRGHVMFALSADACQWTIPVRVVRIELNVAHLYAVWDLLHSGATRRMLGVTALTPYRDIGT